MNSSRPGCFCPYYTARCVTMTIAACRRIILFARNMKRIVIQTLIIGILLATSVLLPTLTLGNAGWHIRRAFPSAKPYFDPVNSPNYTFSSLLRIVIPTYFGFDESLGVLIEDVPGEIDLQRGFNQIPHKSFFGTRLRRCKVTNLCDTNQVGNPSFILFEDCDFSSLPEDQKSRLHIYNTENPNNGKVYIGSV